MKDYPAVSKWALGLSKRSEFTTAVWKASDDGGFPSYHKFLLRSRKPLPLVDISSHVGKGMPPVTPPVGKAPPTGSSSSQGKKSGAASKGSKGEGSARTGKSPQETRKSPNGTASPVSEFYGANTFPLLLIAELNNGYLE